VSGVDVRVIENKILKRVFGTKIEDILAIWRNLHNEELHNMYYSPSTIGIKSRDMK
jgi:hypothetical protein